VIAAKYARLAELLSRQSPERQAALLQHLGDSEETTDGEQTAPAGSGDD
jgi:hypothetical protein